MANIKKRGRGGARAGAGRPPNAPDAPRDYGTGDDPIRYLKAVLSDPTASPTRRDLAARTLLPYVERKMIDILGFGRKTGDDD
jgi:hypothetical protein